MYWPLNALWSYFNDSPYVHSPSPLQWHQWTVYYITCDRMEAAVFSPCLAHVEDVHSVYSFVSNGTRYRSTKNCCCVLTTTWPQTLASTDETQTSRLLKMILHRLTLKGAQEKDKTPSEPQWNWLELQCWLIKPVHQLIPKCALTGLKEK